MHTLPLSFALLSYSGYWRPPKWPADSFKYRLYNVYSVLMVSLLYSFTFYAFVDFAISKDLKATTDKSSLFISVLGVSIKVANLFLKREKIVGVVDSLLNENCIPRDEEERIIQKKFDSHARKLTLYCEILNESAASFATVAQFNKFIGTRTLPVSNWAPYDLSSQEVFVISLLHQTFGLLVCANASVGHETLISGLMIQVSAQFEIFCHRARSLPSLLRKAKRDSVSAEDLRNKRKQILKDVVEQHLGIYKA
ncbi:uncharacterized protein LOC116424848 isoform X2 [Nomia melanderi]|uniref:uncharacterized protein LOC116424848 isoform X2 n=1 Tax=Nomia melanderi TaxID=2448451 RepID=UPI0013045430|nr:uncharacterized protein LOC116424849 [Nomia melanderi]